MMTDPFEALYIYSLFARFEFSFIKWYYVTFYIFDYSRFDISLQ